MNKIIKISSFCASLAFFVGIPGGAGAIMIPGTFGPLDIDLRDASFGAVPCLGSTGCTALGVTITPTGGTGKLFWAADDGFGVQGGEFDEVNTGETLTVSFSSRLLTGVWFTDMFTPPSVGADQAIVELFLGITSVFGTIPFFGTEPVIGGVGVNNGGLFGSFGGAFLADSVVFTSPAASCPDPGLADGAGCNDYSVAGLQVVPLPGALGLMVSGLAAFVVMARRRRKAAAA